MDIKLALEKMRFSIQKGSNFIQKMKNYAYNVHPSKESLNAGSKELLAKENSPKTVD
jgi:hypothetical protein